MIAGGTTRRESRIGELVPPAQVHARGDRRGSGCAQWSSIDARSVSAAGSRGGAVASSSATAPIGKRITRRQPSATASSACLEEEAIGDHEILQPHPPAAGPLPAGLSATGWGAAVVGAIHVEQQHVVAVDLGRAAAAGRSYMNSFQRSRPSQRSRAVEPSANRTSTSTGNASPSRCTTTSAAIAALSEPRQIVVRPPSPIRAGARVVSWHRVVERIRRAIDLIEVPRQVAPGPFDSAANRIVGVGCVNRDRSKNSDRPRRSRGHPMWRSSVCSHSAVLCM